MPGDEVRDVLAQWIRQANSPLGSLPEGTDPADWVADRLTAWWRDQADDFLGDAERATGAVRVELMRLGGWEAFGEALHELIHAEDALGDLRRILGLDRELR
ncbi:MAG: hypothetical protein U0835_02865 [Isosphaeraceae bacterium]